MISVKISELLEKDALSLSFEVFPPKTEAGFESVKSATEEIAKLCPAFMSVTYGAGGGTSKYTLDIAKNIKELYGVPTLAHLTCVSSTRETVKEKIEQITAAGISNVMALRGDIPPGLENADRSGWDYKHAVELVRELKESNAGFCIAVTAVRISDTLKKRLMQAVIFLQPRCFLTTICFTAFFIKSVRQA